MRAVLALAAAAAVALAAAGCGAGTPVSERRAVGAFGALEVSDGVNVRVVRAPAPTVTVDAGDAVVDRVVTEVSGGVLHVGVRDRGIVIGSDPLRHARVRVALPRLDDVQVSGGSDVDLAGLDGDSLALHMSGHGDVTARGRVRHLTAEVSGPGDARLAGLTARTAAVVVRGPGDIELNATRALDIEVSGPADVTYRGSPRVTQRVSGPADVTHVGP